MGTVKPSTKPPRTATRSQVGMPGDQVAWDSEVPTYARYRKECSGSDYDAPLDAEQGGGRLEFTCLPPERDTMRTCVGGATGLWESCLSRAECFGYTLTSTKSTRSETNYSFIGTKRHSRFTIISESIELIRDLKGMTTFIF